jgi:kumamolisin
MSTDHVTLPGSERPMKRGAVRIRDLDPETPVEVTVTLRGPALPDADHLPAQTLSPEEFAAAYGAGEQDAATVTRVLAEYGLTVRNTDLATRSIVASGPARAIEAAFHPHLGVYHHAEQGEYRGREGAVQVPAPLDDIVTGVLGLDQRRVARRNSTDTPAAPPPSMLGPMGPAALEAQYAFPPGDGAGQSIAIAEFGGSYQPADLAMYAAQNGRPVASVNVVQVNPVPPALADTYEVMMDVEIVAGLCPAAAISVLFGSLDQKGWVDVINRVIKDRPVVLSVSWGLAEDDVNTWSAAARTEVNQRLQAAAMLGITVCVSAGDDGSGDQLDDGRAHVNFPAASPFVLSVGGTMPAGTPAAPVEQVWYQPPGTRAGGGGATGGGVSTCFARPAWQNVHVASVNPGSIDGRVVPDVSALAGLPGYSVVVDGQPVARGGTSASTPLWAALIARVNAALRPAQRQRFLTPLLYQTTSGGGVSRGSAACRDITVGQNASYPCPGKGYSATPGYDAVSGWGTPIGTHLLSVLGN